VLSDGLGVADAQLNLCDKSEAKNAVALRIRLLRIKEGINITSGYYLAVTTQPTLE